MDVTPETVRRYTIDADIHEFRSYISESHSNNELNISL